MNRAPRSVPVLFSTVSAEVLEMVARGLPPQVALVDAPVSGGVRGAEQGTLTMLIGGDETTGAAIGLLMDCLAHVRIHCGAVGTARTLKILNNAVGVSVAVLAGEVYRLAIERGLEPALLSRVMEACSGRSARSLDPAGPQAAYRALALDRRAFAGNASIIREDLGLAGRMAAGQPCAYPALVGLRALLAALDGATFDNRRRVAGLPPADGDPA